MSKTAVYTAIIPEADADGRVYPPQRQAEIDKCSSNKVKKEKYYVWKLLEYAILQDFGENMENIRFEKKEGGGWLADKLFFSLSHTDRVVAVAVSNKRVGVDVEAVRPHREGLESRILTAREMTELESIDGEDAWEYIIKRWTQKESIFKTQDKALFEPTKIETADFRLRTEHLELPFGRYMLSVCTEDEENLKIESYSF